MSMHEIEMPDIMRSLLIAIGENPDNYGCMAIDSSKEKDSQYERHCDRVPSEGSR